MRFVTYLKLLVKPILLFFISFISVGLFLISTNPGLFLSMKLLSAFLPGELSFTALKGQLIRGFSFDEARYINAKQTIHIVKGEVRWQFKPFFHQSLDIKKLHAQQLLLSLPEDRPHEKAKRVSLPTLPFAINIDELLIDSLEIYREHSGKKTRLSHIETLKTKASFHPHQWRIRLDFQLAKHQFLLKSELSPDVPYQLNSSLAISALNRGKKSFNGNVSLKGNWLDYHFKGRLQKPGLVTLDGHVLQGQTWQASLKSADFSWPLSSHQQLKLTQSEATLNGTLKESALSLTSHVQSPFPADISLKAKRFDDKLSSDIQLSHQSGVLSFALNYMPLRVPKMVGSLQGELSKQPLGPLSQGDIKAQFSGDKLSTLSLQAELNAHYFTHPLRVSLSCLNQHWQLMSRLGKNTLALTHSATEGGHLDGDFPDPKLLHPTLQGLESHIKASAKWLNSQQGMLRLVISKGRWQNPGENVLPLVGGELQATLDSKQLQTKGKFSIDATKNLHYSLALPHFRYQTFSSKQAITGAVHLNIQSLAFLSSFIPGSRSDGQLEASLIVNGQLENPAIEGKMVLNHGQFSLPKWGILLHSLTTTLQSHHQQWTAQGSALLNNKTLNLQGSGQFYPVHKGGITITGDDLLVVNTDDYKINASPKLTFNYSPDLLSLRGQIVIPKAEIKPQTFTSSVNLTDDAVFVSEAPPPNPYNIDMDIMLQMGNEVMLGIKGLQGLLTGNIRLQQSPEQPLTARGELTIKEGKYQAYGQNLVIDNGQLVFNGPLENPSLNVRAVRQFKRTDGFSSSNQLMNVQAGNIQTLDFGNKTTVGIAVTGRVHAPKVQLFSIPSSLSQADILSLLLLGKPANQANKASGQLLMAAVSALNLDGGSGNSKLLQQLKNALGVDVSLESNTEYSQKTNQSTDRTAVVVSKTLSKRLALSYNFGLSQTDSNTLTLKYLLSKFFSIQISANMTASGIDLLYTREKD